MLLWPTDGCVIRNRRRRHRHPFEWHCCSSEDPGSFHVRGQGPSLNTDTVGPIVHRSPTAATP
jgi:hypothetical protein